MHLNMFGLSHLYLLLKAVATRDHLMQMHHRSRFHLQSQNKRKSCEDSFWRIFSYLILYVQNENRHFSRVRFIELTLIYGKKSREKKEKEKRGMRRIVTEAERRLNGARHASESVREMAARALTLAFVLLVGVAVSRACLVEATTDSRQKQWYRKADEDVRAWPEMFSVDQDTKKEMIIGSVTENPWGTLCTSIDECLA